MKLGIDEFITKEKSQEILQTLVRTNTTNPPGNEMDLVHKILDYFPREKIKYDILNHGNNRGSLIISLPGQMENQSIAFIGHIDTVPVTDENEWTYPPFGAFVEGDELHGRGSADMKGGVTAMILTALYFIENKLTPPQTLKFCFTADEESDGIGVTAIREAGFLNDMVRLIIPEPSNEKIGLGEKGALWLSIKAEGKASHGSRPDIGTNAVSHLIQYIKKLSNLVNTTKREPLLGNATFQITTFHGGVKTNIIPDLAEATIDIRTVPGNDHENIIAKGRDIARQTMEQHPDLNIEFSVENNRPPLIMDENNDFIKEWKDVFRQLSYESVTKGLNFYTDASQVIPQLDVPFVILGPGKEEMAHQVNEKTNLSAVEQIAKIYIQYIMNQLEKN